MKMLILVVAVLMGFLFFNRVEAGVLFPEQMPIAYAFEIIGHCANTNNTKILINECTARQIEKYGELSTLEGALSRKTVNCDEITRKCWVMSYDPIFHSMEKILACIKAEIKKGYPQ